MINPCLSGPMPCVPELMCQQQSYRLHACSMYQCYVPRAPQSGDPKALSMARSDYRSSTLTIFYLTFSGKGCSTYNYQVRTPRGHRRRTRINILWYTQRKIEIVVCDCMRCLSLLSIVGCSIQNDRSSLHAAIPIQIY